MTISTSSPSTASIRNELATLLGSNMPTYWRTLQMYLTGKFSRGEFEDSVRGIINTSNLVQLHNSLLISLLDTSQHLGPPTPPPDVPKQPIRKRRKILPEQGPDDPTDLSSLRSHRLKQPIVQLGKRERERLRTLDSLPEKRARISTDEIAMERGVLLLPERGDPAGSRLPLQLCGASRHITPVHVAERVNLISAQHNLNAPSKAVCSLVTLAVEAKIKQLITRALSTTSSSQTISSIQPSSPHFSSRTLSASAFETLFALSPTVLPNQSAAAMRLSIGDIETPPAPPDLTLLPHHSISEEALQLIRLLQQRSGLS